MLRGRFWRNLKDIERPWYFHLYQEWIKSDQKVLRYGSRRTREGQTDFMWKSSMLQNSRYIEVYHFNFNMGLGTITYADPGIFVRGGPSQSDKKKLWQHFFFSPQLILQKSNGQFQKNLSFFKVPEGVRTFSRGGGGGGVQHFPGGGPIAYSL